MRVAENRALTLENALGFIAMDAAADIPKAGVAPPKKTAKQMKPSQIMHKQGVTLKSAKCTCGGKGTCEHCKEMKAEKANGHAPGCRCKECMEAGGPGSGRHASGISQKHHDAIQQLRRMGFKHQSGADDKGSSTQMMTKIGSDGRTHVMSVSKGSFTHYVQNKAGNRINQKGSGRHSALKGYLAKQKF